MYRHSLAYDLGRYAFIAGRPPTPPRETIDETIDWIKGYECEAAARVHYARDICSAQ
jgi:hypothetical protein